MLTAADAAAAILKRRTARGRAEFSFPASYALAERLFRLLPRGVQRAIVRRLPSG